MARAFLLLAAVACLAAGDGGPRREPPPPMSQPDAALEVLILGVGLGPTATDALGPVAVAPVTPGLRGLILHRTDGALPAVGYWLDVSAEIEAGRRHALDPELIAEVTRLLHDRFLPVVAQFIHAAQGLPVRVAGAVPPGTPPPTAATPASLLEQERERRRRLALSPDSTPDLVIWQTRIAGDRARVFELLTRRRDALRAGAFPAEVAASRAVCWPAAIIKPVAVWDAAAVGTVAVDVFPPRSLPVSVPHDWRAVLLPPEARATAGVLAAWMTRRDLVRVDMLSLPADPADAGSSGGTDDASPTGPPERLRAWMGTGVWRMGRHGEEVITREPRRSVSVWRRTPTALVGVVAIATRPDLPAEGDLIQGYMPVCARMLADAVPARGAGPVVEPTTP